MTSDTDADCTPGTAASAFSTALLHAEQCIPPTSNSNVCTPDWPFLNGECSIAHVPAKMTARGTHGHTANVAEQELTHRALTSSQRFSGGQVRLETRVFDGIQDVRARRFVLPVNHLRP